MGNIIIGQSGGPTAVINSSLAGAIKAAQDAGIPKIYGMHHGIEGFLKEDIIDLDVYFKEIYDLSLLKRTPSAFLGSCRYQLPVIKDNEETYEQIFRTLDKYDIEFFLYNGGNDSMDTIKKLSNYAAINGKKQKFIGIPKTIDNDLPITDHTPGYGSASKYIATPMKELIRDNESFGASKPTLCVVEIMGRNAGWLTAASALARDADCGGPDLIYLPETDFEDEKFLDLSNDLIQRKSSVVIAVSEGARYADGTLVCEAEKDYDSGYVDAFGHKQLSGAGRALADRLVARFGLKTRVIEFSTLQRCATHLASRVDIDEAFNVGYVAAKTAFRGETGKMISIKVVSRQPYIAEYEPIDVGAVANLEKKVPAEWITNDGTYVSKEFLHYVRPLVIGDLSPYYAQGLPRHLTLHNLEDMDRITL